MTKIINIFFLCLLPCVIVSIGCGGGGPPKPADLPPLFPCTLTITQDGAPLPDAATMLVSTSPAFKWSVGGSTDEGGKVVVLTNGVHRGAPAGTYKVTVRKTVVRERVGDDLKIAELVDPQFKTAQTTTLEIEIAKGNNDKAFDVGKAVNIETIK